MKESYCIVDKRVTPCTEPSGVGDAVGPIKTGINMGQKISETLFPQTKQVFKDYWSGDIAKGVVNSEDGIFTSNFWTGDTTVFRYDGKKFYFKEGNPIMSG